MATCECAVVRIHRALPATTPPNTGTWKSLPHTQFLCNGSIHLPAFYITQTHPPPNSICHNLTDINFRTPSSYTIAMATPRSTVCCYGNTHLLPCHYGGNTHTLICCPPPALLLIIWIYPPFLCGRTCCLTHHRQLWRCAPAPPSPVGGGRASGSAGSRWLLPDRR